MGYMAKIDKLVHSNYKLDIGISLSPFACFNQSPKKLFLCVCLAPLSPYTCWRSCPNTQHPTRRVARAVLQNPSLLGDSLSDPL